MSDSYYELIDPADPLGERFRATDMVRSTWSSHIQHGGPVSALLVRAMERCERRPDTRLSRVVVDLLGGVPAELSDPAYLAAQRVRICLQGHQPFMAAVGAVHASLKALREGTKPADLKGVAYDALMKQVTREADFDRWTGEYLGG